MADNILRWNEDAQKLFLSPQTYKLPDKVVEGWKDKYVEMAEKQLFKVKPSARKLCVARNQTTDHKVNISEKIALRRTFRDQLIVVSGSAEKTNQEDVDRLKMNVPAEKEHIISALAVLQKSSNHGTLAQIKDHDAGLVPLLDDILHGILACYANAYECEDALEPLGLELLALYQFFRTDSATDANWYVCVNRELDETHAEIKKVVPESFPKTGAKVVAHLKAMMDFKSGDNEVPGPEEHSAWRTYVNGAASTEEALLRVHQRCQSVHKRDVYNVKELSDAVLSTIDAQPKAKVLKMVKDSLRLFERNDVLNYEVLLNDCDAKIKPLLSKCVGETLTQWGGAIKDTISGTDFGDPSTLAPKCKKIAELKAKARSFQSKLAKEVLEMMEVAEVCLRKPTNTGLRAGLLKFCKVSRHSGLQVLEIKASKHLKDVKIAVDELVLSYLEHLEGDDMKRLTGLRGESRVEFVNANFNLIREYEELVPSVKEFLERLSQRSAKRPSNPGDGEKPGKKQRKSKSSTDLSAGSSTVAQLGGFSSALNGNVPLDLAGNPIVPDTQGFGEGDDVDMYGPFGPGPEAGSEQDDAAAGGFGQDDDEVPEGFGEE